jgi:outer membrane receptor protein involved in Fe transport
MARDGTSLNDGDKHMIERGNNAPKSCVTALAAAANLLLMGASAWAQTAGPADDAKAAAAAAKKAEKEQKDELPAVVVTGVLVRTTADKAALSVTTIDEERLRAVVPVSAADLLTEVPGVVVTSDAGEVRNTVYTRGISNGTSSGTVGYYWNALMEDGLPVIGMPLSNFSPDMFLRADATVKSVQAVRGGSAAVTGPNAPAGLFNYISKNGLTDPGGMIGMRLGVENEDKPENLYKKFDFYYGSRNADRTFGWSIGGHLRHSFGYRDFEKAPNKGGQLKGNLNWRYNAPIGKGEVQVGFKFLQDQVAHLDIARTLAHGWGPIVFDTPLGRVANLLPVGDLAHAVPSGLNGRVDYWDPSDMARYESKGVTVKVNHDFGNGWKLNNTFRGQSNLARYNMTEGTSFNSITTGTALDWVGRSLMGLGSTAGYYTFFNRATGQVYARVNQRTSASTATGAACSSTCLQTTTPNLLPNASLATNSSITANNLVVGVSAMNNRMQGEDYLNLITVSRDFEFAPDNKLTLTAGGYFTQNRFWRNSLNAGLGLTTLENNPTTMGVTFTTQASTPVTYQLTNPNGFASIAGLGGGPVSNTGSRFDDAHSREISPLFGAVWEKGNWVVDFGARFTDYKVWGTNYQYSSNSSITSRSFGGLDGNTLTLWDNAYAVDLGNRVNFSKTSRYWQYTGALSYKLGKRENLYARYTRGVKNAMETEWGGFTSEFLRDGLDPNLLPIVQQAEIGYNVQTKGFSLQVSPYYVDLDKVGLTSSGVASDGVTQYRRPRLYSHYRSYGVEVDSRYRIVDWLSMRNVLTLNKSDALSVASWVSGCGVEFAGVQLKDCATGVTPFPDTPSYASGPQDRSAKVIYNGTLNFDFDDFGGYYRFRYIGKRPTTTAALAYLPANKVSDIGMYYNVTDKLRIDFNVNNLLDDRNATQIGQLGTLPTGVTLDQFIAQNPNALVTVQTNAPRSFFLSATLRF